MALAAIFIIQASKPTFYRKNTILTEIYSIQWRIQGVIRNQAPPEKFIIYLSKSLTKENRSKKSRKET